MNEKEAIKKLRRQVRSLKKQLAEIQALQKQECVGRSFHPIGPDAIDPYGV
ncbi:MAG TPA: hypothetical protein VMW50_08370 [Dehalococcoidia bacterium]|nr:hypothetical protein [Dehalococcoidia bacterium]